MKPTDAMFSFVAVSLIGAVVVALLPAASRQGRRLVFLLVTLIELALGLLAAGSLLDLPGQFTLYGILGLAGPRLSEGIAELPWSPSLGLDLQFGIDHLSAPALIVIPLLFLVAAGTRSAEGRGTSIGLLVALASLQGIFTASNLLLLALFSQTAVFGLFFALCLTRDQGDAGTSAHTSERHRVALRFLLFNYPATLGLLAAALSVRSTAQQRTGSPQLDPEQLLTLALPAEAQMWIAIAFGLFLAIQLPIPPFHGWFVDLIALRTRTATVAILIAGAWPLVATYVMLRFALSLCPEPVELIGGEWGGSIATWVAVYAGALALAQRASMQRQLALVCVSFNAVILLGLWTLTSQGIQGSLVYALNHGVVRALLLALALSAVTKAQSSSWQSGLLWCAIIVFVGFPASAPFSGFLLCVIAGFAVSPGHTMVTLVGLFIAASNLFTGVGRGTPTGGGVPQRALTATAAVVLGLTLYLGLHPGPLIRLTAPAAAHVSGWLPTTGYSVLGAGGGDQEQVVPVTTDTTGHSPDEGQAP